MTKVRRGILLLLSLMTAAAMAAASTASNTITVDCSRGQSLNQTLAKLDKHTPTTVAVSGTCSEYVQAIGFENLTLKGQPGATLLDPGTGTGTLFNTLLYIESSTSVLVSGFTVQAGTSVTAIAIGHGSSDIRLRYLNITGGSESITVFENSQASIAYVSAQAPGYTTLGIYDSSDVHLEHSQFAGTGTSSVWNVGVALGASHVTMYDVTISNMQQGISAANTSIVDILYYDTYYNTGGPTDVTISNTAGINFNGVTIDGGGSLNVTGARLVINKAGQTWGSNTGGVLLSDGAIMNASNGNLVITGSYGQGVIAINNAHATMTGATVQGGVHGGLVTTNLSSIDVSTAGTLSNISGNGVDLFCDANSWVTGTANISGTRIINCANLLSTETVVLP